MKFLITPTVIFLLLISCSRSNETKINLPQQILENPTSKISRKSIFPDFINLSETDFNRFETTNTSKWFKFKNQRLYFVTYTDYSITTLVLTNEILDNKNLIDLFKAENINFEDSADAIETNEMITDKKIQLNASKSFVENIYGKSDLVKIDHDKENLFWNFLMKDDRENYEFGNLKPFVLDGLTFNVEMIFRNDSLKTLIYRYEVP